MGATSVTGKGNGSVDGSNKGSEHMSLGHRHLIGPRIQLAGLATLVAGTLDVVVPDQGTLSEYGVLCTGTAAAARSSAITDNSNGSWTFTLTGTTTDAVKWAMVHYGF